MRQIGVSTVAFKSKKEIEIFYKETGIPLEYSVNLLPDDISYLLDIHIPCTSVHIPSPTREFFPNFASANKTVFQKSIEILKESMNTLFNCGGTTLVLHPGYATDFLIPSDYKLRKPFIEKGIERYKNYIIDKNGAVTGRDYLLSEDYIRYFKIFSENILKVLEFVKTQGFLLAIENLNPRLYYILQTPQEIKDLSKLSPDIHFCLDFGHLYISSLTNKFNFLEGIREILDTNKVIHFHISNNPSSPGYYDDAHDHIDRGKIEYSSLFPLIKETDANYILEIKYNPKEDIKILKKYFK